MSGDVVRRLVSRTIAQQVSEAVEAGTAPFQYTLSTRACSECVAHALQALCELDPAAMVVSVDGIGFASDCTTRRSFRPAVLRLPIHLFVGERRRYHRIEQGDPLMPMLFALGQHPVLVAALRRFHAGERLFACLDDLSVVTTLDRVGAVHAILSGELWRHSRSVECGRHPSSSL